MAYFSNGSDPGGVRFSDECESCRYGQKPCPIAGVQFNYNYDAVGNKTATEILDDLVKNDGRCEMFRVFQKDFELTEGEKAQLDLFDELGCGNPAFNGGN